MRTVWLSNVMIGSTLHSVIDWVEDSPRLAIEPATEPAVPHRRTQSWKPGDADIRLSIPWQIVRERLLIREGTEPDINR